ncbi:MAG: hypothetical protein R2681_04190 [Pyrinomonadaceae bacterium]
MPLNDLPHWRRQDAAATATETVALRLSDSLVCLILQGEVSDLQIITQIPASGKGNGCRPGCPTKNPHSQVFTPVWHHKFIAVTMNFSKSN